MAKKPSINNITTGYTSAEAINANFQNVRDAFDNTLSLDELCNLPVKQIVVSVQGQVLAEEWV